MQFINEAPLYRIVRIAGPKHNLLGLELADSPLATAPAMEMLDAANPTVRHLSAEDVLNM